MLKLINVTKKYNDHVVLREISLDFSKPGIYVLEGKNGSGKSTILKIIAGIIYKTSGSILSDVSTIYLPDKYNMPKLMKVKSYIMELLEGGSNKKLLVDKLMKEYKLPDKRIGELSKGNLQKVGIVQTLLNNVDCYLLDEPFDGLDDFAKELLKNKLFELRENKKIVILSLHGEELINELNATVYKLKNGKLLKKKRRDNNEEK